MKRNLLFSLSALTFISVLFFIPPYSAAAGYTKVSAEFSGSVASDNTAESAGSSISGSTAESSSEADTGTDSLTPKEERIIEAPLLSVPSDVSRKATTPEARKTSEKVISVTGGSDYLLFLESGEDASSLPLDNMVYTNALVTLEGESRGSLFPIEYDLSSLDTSAVGLQFLHGTVIVPDHYEISEEMKDVTIPVAVHNALNPFEMPVTGVVDRLEPYCPLASTVGTPREELQKYLLSMYETGYYEVSGQYICSVDLTWDCGGIDTYTPGTYKVTAGISLPDGILFPDTIKFPYSIIDIQDPDKLTLSTPVFNYLNGYIDICWVKETPLRDLFHLWYKKGDGPWREDNDEDFMSLSESYDGTCQKLRIFADNLEENVPYYLNIEYDGEISNILTLVNTPGGYIHDSREGDRDGGDSNRQVPPDIIQTQPETSPDHTSSDDEVLKESLPRNPYSQAAGSGGDGSSHGSDRVVCQDFPETVPQVPETPGQIENAETGTVSTASEAFRRNYKNHGDTDSSEAAAPYTAKGTPKDITTWISITPGQPVPEEDASDYTVWSGSRILKLMETNPNQPLVFEKHGIRMEFPTDSEILACISETSSLRVETRLLDKNRIYTDISMNGVPMADLPEFTISLPWDASEGEGPWMAAAEDGTAVEAHFIPGKHRLEFTINTTGIITIHCPHTPGEQGPESRPRTGALLAGCSLTILLPAILWICYIRRRNEV